MPPLDNCWQSAAIANGTISGGGGQRQDKRRAAEGTSGNSGKKEKL